MTISINNKSYEVDANITYAEAARLVQDEYKYTICGAKQGGKLKSLFSSLKAEGDIEFITMEDSIGLECYKRSAAFLCIRAFHKVLGLKLHDIKVQFSISKGYYMDIKADVAITEELISTVDKVMRDYVAADAPIRRHTLSTDEAIELFKKENMQDKVALYAFRRSSTMRVYELDDYYDYFYGYMLPSCGAIKTFGLYKYDEGVCLQLPTTKEPDKLPEFVPQVKVTSALLESTRWSEKVGISNVGELNRKIVDGSIKDFILVQEAVQNQKLSDIASEIKDRGNVKFIMIAGPSSSGKTSFSHRLSIHLRAHGLKPHPIAVDNYFVDREFTPRDENGEYNYEDLDSIDIELFNRNMSDLLAGKKVDMPEYDFVAGVKKFKGNYLQLGDNDILVIEGIHCLNSALYPTLPQESMYKVYISALTQLNIDDHNRIATTDGRLIRRMVRDARTRGNSAQDTIARWGSVRRGEEKNIFPYQESADVVFNSAQVYELSILKPYAEAVLFSVPTDASEYLEAKRLLKFLDYFLTLPVEGIPNDSILREFAGGSVFKV